MYVQKRGDKFRFFETYIDPRTRLRKTASVTMDRNTVKSRVRAQELLNARIRKLTTEPGKSTPMTLKELYEAYFEYQEAHVSQQTVRIDRFASVGIMELLGEDTDINTLDARYITSKLDGSGETPTRKNYRLKHIRKLLRWAHQYDYVHDISYLSKIKKYKDNERSRREYKYLENDELRQLLDAMTVEKYKVLTEFLALTGLRIGEALALTKDDIDIDARTISVTKSFSHVTREVGSAKTEDSNRVIRIQTELLPLMEKVLPDCFKRIDYDSYRKYLKETTEKVIGRELTPHALRHTHTSLLAASGVPLDVISRRLGHHDSKITTDIYMHITSKMKDRDAALLDAIRIM